jgi:O-antigen ligase
VLLLGIAAIPLMSALENSSVRVASTEDGSAEGRATQRYYGMRLLSDRPLGYGLAFESTEHWAPYADEVIYMSNPMTIRNFALHNYFLMMLNKYGVMMLALLLLLVPRSRSEALCWAGFVPYGVHIFYHNDGPLQGDFFIWYLLPLFAIANSAMSARPPIEGAVRPWSRTYRARQRAREAGHA